MPVSCLFKLGFGELVVTWSGRCQSGRLQLTPDGFCLKALVTLFVRHVTTLIHLVHAHYIELGHTGLNATAQVMLICPVDGTEEIANPFASA